MNVEPLPLPLAPLLVGAVLTIGAFAVAVVDAVAVEVIAGRAPSARAALLRPLDRARRLLGRQVVRTERPDAVVAVLAPAAYLGLAAGALAVVPLSSGRAIADVRTGIVVFGAAEALAIVAVFLRGWAPNSAFPLVAGYRFVAVALSYELLSMFVLIAAALPAESLSVGAIVEAQAGLWNVVRQPLGLPLWLVVCLGVTFTGPLAVVASPDLAGGADAEESGGLRLAWAVGRAAMLTVFAVAGAAVFLGGWHGPLLPGPLWMALKAAVLLVVLVVLGRTTARIPPQRFVPLAWKVLLPLAFADLLVAGLGSL